MLSSQATVRVRIDDGDVGRAVATLEMLAGSGSTQRLPDPSATWLSVRFDPDRAADVNRALAQAGIFVARLEAGAELETLFLELTGDPGAPTPDLPAPGTASESGESAAPDGGER